MTTPFAAAPSTNWTAEQQVIADQVEAFRNAQFDQDVKALDELCADELSYSHSDGHTEDKATFVDKATDGRYEFNTLQNLAMTVNVVGSVATVRFNWVARQTWRDGKVTDTNMAILMVWLKRDEDWKLLARSATKL